MILKLNHYNWRVLNLLLSLLHCVTSGFRRDVNEIWALLGVYTAQSGNSAPTFRANLLQWSRGPKDGTSRFVPKRRHGISTLRCVTVQSSADFLPLTDNYAKLTAMKKTSPDYQQTEKVALVHFQHELTFVS